MRMVNSLMSERPAIECLRIFELKIDNPSSKDLTGTAKTRADEKETKLDAAFQATLK